MNGMRLQRDDQDGGFTFVELLVTMLITGLVIAMAGTFFATVSRITSWSGSDRDATGRAALALDAIRAVVRVAADNPASATVVNPAVLVASSTKLELTAYSNTSSSSTSPTRVTFEIDASGNLVQTRRAGVLSSAGYWAFTGAVTVTRIASGFSTSPSIPFFAYVNNLGQLKVSATGLSEADRKAITYIRVTPTLRTSPTLSVRGADGKDSSLVVTTSIGMPNVNRDVVSTVSVPALPTPTQTPVITPTPTPTTASPAPSAPSVTPTTGGGSGTPSASASGSGSATPTTGPGSGSATPSGSASASSTPSASGQPSTSGSPSSTPTVSATPTPTPKKPVVG